MQRIESLEHSLPSNTYPFFQSGFLNSLSQHGCLDGNTGWSQHYLHTRQNIILPAFVKTHSYGEYVFDWSWAEAYENHGLQYYPKLIIAAPFTPATGPRLLPCNKQQALNKLDGQTISQDIQTYVAEKQLSGAHILFMTPTEHNLLKDHNWHTRYGVQFHWFNDHYKSFDDFISRFKSRKRKTLLKERQLIQKNNIHIKKLHGPEIDDAMWLFFYQCYQNTYARRGMQGYISLPAFKRMGLDLAQQTLMIVAFNDLGEPLACALYFFDDKNLYGRYWGSLYDMPFLHFELCYYQGIEHCIESGLEHFDPGTQGEHKIARGFEPIFTQSLHYLAHEGFHEAVGDFVKQEFESLKIYKKECYGQLPFNEQFKPKPRDFIFEA